MWCCLCRPLSWRLRGVGPSTWEVGSTTAHLEREEGSVLMQTSLWLSRCVCVCACVYLCACVCARCVCMHACVRVSVNLLHM